MKLVGKLLAGLAVVAAAVAFTQPAFAQDSSVDAIKKRGKLQVGFATFVPWAMRDKQGKWVGFEIDVSTKLAKDMGVELELIPTAWDGIIPSLIAGKFDVIIGGMTVTPARREQIDFTEAYSVSGLGAAASKQLAANLKWPEGYNDTKVTFACRRGSSPCGYIERTFPKATLRQFDDMGVGYQEVINGNAHAFISAEPMPSFKVLDNADRLFKPNREMFEGGFEGMGLKKGNPTTLKFFNDWIAANKGWLDERRGYWMRSRDWVNLVPAS